MERWSRVVHLRHPSISRQERRHAPRETLGLSSPSKVPRITRHHECRIPVKDPPDTQSTSNDRETIQTHQSCSLIPTQARRVNTALHLKTPQQESSRHFQNCYNLKGGRELFTPSENLGPSAPFQVPRVTRRHGCQLTRTRVSESTCKVCRRESQHTEEMDDGLSSPRRGQRLIVSSRRLKHQPARPTGNRPRTHPWNSSFRWSRNCVPGTA